MKQTMIIAGSIVLTASIWIAAASMRTTNVSLSLLVSNVEALAVGEDDYFFHCQPQTGAACICGSSIVIDHYHR